MYDFTNEELHLIRAALIHLGSKANAAVHVTNACLRLEERVRQAQDAAAAYSKEPGAATLLLTPETLAPIQAGGHDLAHMARSYAKCFLPNATVEIEQINFR